MHRSAKWLLALVVALSSAHATGVNAQNGQWYYFEWAGQPTVFSSAADHTYSLGGGSSSWWLRMEVTLRLDYQLSCSTYQNGFPGVVVEIDYDGRRRRVELLRFTPLSTQWNARSGWTSFREVQLGAFTPYAPVRVFWHDQPASRVCTLSYLRVEPQYRWFYTWANDLPEVAFRNAPYIGVRDNQCGFTRDTDIPFQVRWTAASGINVVDRYGTTHYGTTQIKYNFFYSDEDDTGHWLVGGHTTAGQRLAVYGRRGDTENHYTIYVDGAMNVVHREYVSYKESWGQRYDHMTLPFDGPYLTGTEHAVFKNWGDNNTLERAGAHSSCYGWENGHQAVPVEWVPTETHPNDGEALRDLIYFEEDPWMHWVSEGEHHREGKGESWSDDYFYMVLVNTGLDAEHWHALSGADEPVSFGWWSDWEMDNGRIAGMGISKVNIDAIANDTGRGSALFATNEGSIRAVLGRARFFRLIRTWDSYTATEFTGKFAREAYASAPERFVRYTWSPSAPTGGGCGEASCNPNQGAYISHFTNADCTGTESYYLPYDGWGYSCRSSDGQGVCGTIQRTETNRSYKMGSTCYANAWPDGNELSYFVRIYR
jgi:hypothetical protein